jgi:hypothetical protein
MEHSSQNNRNEKKEPVEGKEERTEQADQVLCEACEESGIKVSSWQDFGAWQEYVDGKINDAALADKAQMELVEFAKSFGKYLVIEKEDPTPPDDPEKKERVKRANRIYRTLCDATGLSFCFFNNFATWSDYVEGNITEQEFLQQAKLEVEKMVSEAN